MTAKPNAHTEEGVDNSESTVGDVLADTNGTCIHKAKIQMDKLFSICFHGIRRYLVSRHVPYDNPLNGKSLQAKMMPLASENVSLGAPMFCIHCSAKKHAMKVDVAQTVG